MSTSADSNASGSAAFPRRQIQWIRDQARACERRSRIHDSCRRHFHALDVASLTTTIGLSTLSSILSLFGNPCTQPGIKIATGVLNLSITGLTSWYGIHKYGERKRNHETTRDAYEELTRKLDTEMVLHETEEQHFRTHGSLIRTTRHLIDRIESNAPNVPGSIAKSEETSRKDLGADGPDEIISEA